jgi:hypothetical protein
MQNNTRRKWLVAGLVIIAWLCGRTESTLVDYDSGALRKVHAVWGLTTHTEPLPATWFSEVTLSNGLTGLTGKPNWHLAVFKRPAAIILSSAHPEGMKVMVLMDQCGQELKMRNSNEATQLKEDFLRALSTEGFSSAYRVYDKSQELRREIYKLGL